MVRTDIDQRRKEIEDWMSKEVPLCEIAHRLHCKQSTVKWRLREWGYDGYNRQGWKYGLRTYTSYNIENHLKLNSHISSNDLKFQLLSSGLKSAICEVCGLSCCSLDGRMIIELDHLNGNRFDNRIDNLLILCPTCHMLKPGGSWGICCKQHLNSWFSVPENILESIQYTNSCIDHKRRYHHDPYKLYVKPKIKPTRENNFNVRKATIRKPKPKIVKLKVTKPTKIEWPPYNALLEMIKIHGYLATSKVLGVSDNAIRKHLKRWT